VILRGNGASSMGGAMRECAPSILRLFLRKNRRSALREADMKSNLWPQLGHIEPGRRSMRFAVRIGLRLADVVAHQYPDAQMFPSMPSIYPCHLFGVL
jgi:hypothetical protein